jgi:hypothetical protein
MPNNMEVINSSNLLNFIEQLSWWATRWSWKTLPQVTPFFTWAMWCELQRTVNSSHQQWAVGIHFSTRAVINLLQYIPKVQWKALLPTHAKAEPQTNNHKTVLRKNLEMPCVCSHKWLIQFLFRYRQRINFCTDRCKSLWLKITLCLSVIQQRPQQTFLMNKKCSRFKKWTIAMKMRAILVTLARTWTLSATNRLLRGLLRLLTLSTHKPLATHLHLVEIKTSSCL